MEAKTRLVWELTDEKRRQMGEKFIAMLENNDSFPDPDDHEGGLKLLTDSGLKIVDPALKGVSFHCSSRELMHIVIPPAELIALAKKILRDGHTVYPVHKTYCQICNSNPTIDLMQQFNFRVGDYTLAHCV